MNGKRGTRIVFTPAQWRVLASAARQELVDVLESAGPCSVARLATLVGRPADALYHHLRQLVRAGLVAETGRRQEGRHVYAVYDLTVRPLHAARAATVRTADVERVVGAAQRLSWRDFRRALAAADAASSGPRRTLSGARVCGWLEPAALARVNALLDELLATLRAGAPGPGRVPLSLSYLLAPLPPERSRRTAPAAARTAPTTNSTQHTSSSPPRRRSRARRPKGRSP